ncbi:mitochondria-eating protein-like isoform X3 [Lineus longissimus]|uniref:mitochondria-eating protein-like isoform X3 n=1 Tax=Lineus longissimus TaxID=88925 RepID=UPI00315DC19B
MADLRRLVHIGAFSTLQDKLDKWSSDYYINTTDQNVARGCELVELVAKVQGQLFKILSQAASDGGLYSGASVLKYRLLPWLGQGFLATGGIIPAELLAENVAKDREINDLQDKYERSITQLEADLRITQDEADTLKADLADSKNESDRTQRASTSEKMFTDSEIRELRSKLEDAESEIQTLKIRVSLVDEYERQIRYLKDDIAILMGRKRVSTPILSGLEVAHEDNKELRGKLGLLDEYERQVRFLKNEVAILNGRRSALIRSKPETPRIIVSDSDVEDSLASYRYLHRTTTPLAADDITQRVRQQSLIARFNDMYTIDRIEAMATLSGFSDDHENNQRIVFSAIQEAFHAAKISFRQFKIKVRSNLAITHKGPETLEEAVQDYINKNTDLYDLPGLVTDVVRALNRNIHISLPAGVSYTVVKPFMREACKLAWGMSALAHPLDLSVAYGAELYDDHKYRRAYDSEFTAPLVNHHVWPCLLQGTHVITKGEAVTRRGASLTSPRRSRSPARSLTPSRALSPRPRSRSPSPRRAASPSVFADDEDEEEEELMPEQDLSLTAPHSMASRLGSGRPSSRSAVPSSLRSTTLPSSLFSESDKSDAGTSFH